MRTSLGILAICLFPSWAHATPEKTYFFGEAKLSSQAGKSMGSQVLLIEKIVDREKSEFTERAVVVMPDGKVEEWSVRMAVKDDNTFTVVDDAKKMEGVGKLFGQPWKWTYFKAKFKTANGFQIDDENFFADESAVTARKVVSAPDGTIVMYMDMTMRSISPEAFRVLRAGLIKK